MRGAAAAVLRNKHGQALGREGAESRRRLEGEQPPRVTSGDIVNRMTAVARADGELETA